MIDKRTVDGDGLRYANGFAKPIRQETTVHEDEEDTTVYQVVVNHEEQYSIWPADRELPLGWNAVGKQGTKQECLDYIEEVWTDMRPLSLRNKMEQDRDA